MSHETFRSADHLPNLREGRDPVDPAGLPRQRRGTTPQMHGRYPDFDVLEHADEWDEVTRETILERVHEVPPIRFFTAAQARCARAFTDVVLAQDAEPRVPVTEMVDAKLHQGKLDGFQHEDMPDDRETWRLVLRGLDEAAGGDFAAADIETQRAIVDRLSNGDLSGGAWDALNVSTAWSVVMRATLSEFYSHPWAWNEIGFGGPAYPRGYMRLGAGERGRDPKEAREAYDVDPVQDLDRVGR